MATAGALSISLLCTVDVPTPGTGTATEKLETVTRWTDGTGSGQIGRVYHATGSLTASGTATLNLLAAGALKDRFNTTVDLDELKGIMIKCLTGQFSVAAAAANGLTCFTGASEGVKLAAGHTLAVDFGAAGLAIGSTGSLTLTETSTSAGATYEIILTGAE